MGIRDALKKREEKREEIRNNTDKPSDLPEGVGRFIRNNELNDEGRTFVILDDPDDWYFYFVHEDFQYKPYEVFVKKHTCINSPRGLGSALENFEKKDGSKCLSCAAGIKRKLYFMVRLYDVEHDCFRIYDAKEFHAQNLVSAYDKIEKTARKFNKEYTLVGDVVQMMKTSDGKSFTFDTADDVELTEAQQAKVKELLAEKPDYEFLGKFRNEEDIRGIIAEAAEGHADKSVLGQASPATVKSDDADKALAEDVKPVAESDDKKADNLPF
ncbi:hypothetical protein [Paludifilum halophilum]|uniref:Uncharacterized protein n=1 Tax=Paludifilum halophilum TaxID=1642702 RepID=A0A235B8F6_9BACL|nr:hypothetical protein [Paludifilum halophilum]OYD08574.1 hypothetical protein CHM34_07050 [Paludifilum halophilum]